MVVLWGVISINAQPYTVGSKDVSFGLGLGSSFGVGSMVIPPISVSFDYGYHEKISIGGYIGFAKSNFESSYFTFTGNATYGYDYSYMIFAARGSYHFLNQENYDVYGGLLLGYNAASAKFYSDDTAIDETLFTSSDVGGPVIAPYVGGRYYFKENLGAFTELGFGVAYFTIGLTLKI